MSAVVFALTAVQGSATGPDVRDALLTEKDAVFMLEPEVVAGPGVSSLQWSPDGTYLMVRRDRLTTPNPLLLMAQGKAPAGPPNGETQFLFYSAPGHKTVAGLRVPFGSLIERTEWIPGSSKALALIQVPIKNEQGSTVDLRRGVYWMSANGEGKALVQAEGNEFFDLHVSPNRPSFAVGRTEFKPGNPGTRSQILYFFDGEGKPTGKVVMPDAAANIVWQPNNQVFAMIGKLVDRKVKWEWFRLNPAQGTADKVTEIPRPSEKEAAGGDLMVSSGKMPSSRPEMPPVDAVFLLARKDLEKSSEKNPPAFACVSTDGTMGALSPAGTSVAYVHKGVAMVRPLARLPKQVYMEMKAAAERTLALSNAKQAVLALIMNAADNDDNLIASGGDWKEQVMPYVKNRDILNAFTYTFAGGNMSSIDKPAETEVGYVTGPGGRAVAYADGHVKWIPNK